MATNVLRGQPMRHWTPRQAGLSDADFTKACHTLGLKAVALCCRINVRTASAAFHRLNTKPEGADNA